jgi:hypothetical protein
MSSKEFSQFCCGSRKNVMRKNNRQLPNSVTSKDVSKVSMELFLGNNRAALTNHQILNGFVGSQS